MWIRSTEGYVNLPHVSNLRKRSGSIKCGIVPCELIAEFPNRDLVVLFSSPSEEKCDQAALLIMQAESDSQTAIAIELDKHQEPVLTVL